MAIAKRLEVQLETHCDACARDLWTCSTSVSSRLLYLLSYYAIVFLVAWV
jgi:hypothetical protein